MKRYIAFTLLVILALPFWAFAQTNDPVEVSPIIGDTNLDHEFNLQDYFMLIRALGGGVDLSERALFLSDVARPCNGEPNREDSRLLLQAARKLNTDEQVRSQCHNGAIGDPFVLEEGPDLLIRLDAINPNRLGADFDFDGGILVAYFLTNNGTEPSGPFNVWVGAALGLDADGDRFAHKERLESEGLDPGETRRGTMTLTRELLEELGIDVGTHTRLVIKVKVDPNHQVAETNESNNEASTTIPIGTGNDFGDRPDLTIRVDTLEPNTVDVVGNHGIIVGVIVSNRGNESSGPFRVWGGIAVNQDASDDRFIHTERDGLRNLDPGESRRETVEITREMLNRLDVDLDELTGIAVKVIVDPTDVVEETNERNNVDLTTIRLGGGDVRPISNIKGSCGPSGQSSVSFFLAEDVTIASISTKHVGNTIQRIRVNGSTRRLPITGSARVEVSLACRTRTEVGGTLNIRLRNGDVVMASVPNPMPLSLNRVQAVTLSNEVQFAFIGSGIQSAQVRVFSMSGQLIHDSGMETGNALSWNLLNQHGQRVANGVYFYVVTVQDVQGKRLQSTINKLAVLR